MCRLLVLSAIFILISLTTTISCNDVLLLNYVPVTSFGVSPAGADDKPTVTVNARSKLQCASKCTQMSGCVIHQLKEGTNQCDLYDFLPTQYSKNPNCTAFATLTDSSACSLEIVEAANCSFPFTSAGKLYYTCANNHTAKRPCTVWCPLLGTFATAVCNTTSYDFVARVVTTNANIAGTAVPLISVNNWLSVMSRVDASFPTSGVDYYAGFGVITSNFWIGLTKLHQLTDPSVNGGHSYRLRFEMFAANGKWASQEYYYFSIGAAPAYAFVVSRTSIGDAGDALYEHPCPANGQAFTTSDPLCGHFGAFWFTNYGSCCGCAWFGPENIGFSWDTFSKNLKIFRMMVKQLT